MQPGGFAIVTGSGYKLYRGMVCILDTMGAYLQAQPLNARPVGLEASGSGADMPGIQQIIEFVQRKCRVAGSHQRFCVKSHQMLRTMKPARAAFVVAFSFSAWAGHTY